MRNGAGITEQQEPALFETYKEQMCHFFIYLDVNGGYKGSSNSLKSWADYLFLTLEEAHILRMIGEHDHRDVILEEDDGIYQKEDTLKSFHHLARQLISQKVLLIGFLSVWLKRCVVLSPSNDAIFLTALLPAIRLVHGHSRGLLPAMVCYI